MLFPDVIFVGVDPTAGSQPFSLAAVNQDGRLVATEEGDLDTIFSFLGSHPKIFLAINSPARPNNGAIKRLDIRTNLSTLHQPGRGIEMRLAEHQLRERGIIVAATPGKQEIAPHWMQLGFMLHRELGSRGFFPFPVEGQPLQWLETQPHAAFCALLGRIPLGRHSLEGRIQRQLVLLDQGLRINDPMDFFDEITRHGILKGDLPSGQIYTPSALDAMVAAFTAFKAANSQDSVTGLGAPEEGLIYLPVSELRDEYQLLAS